MLDDEAFASTTEQRLCLMLARQEIEQLRRWYAHATDLLGSATEAAREKGRRIYHRIFTADAELSVVGGLVPLSAEGPDGWAAVAANALQPYESTQHLIGSQVVTFTSASFDGPQWLTGSATMSSYVQAWHAWPDRRVRLVIGTYEDVVRFDPTHGWQIEQMVLKYASSEERELGKPA